MVEVVDSMEIIFSNKGSERGILDRQHLTGHVSHLTSHISAFFIQKTTKATLLWSYLGLK